MCGREFLLAKLLLLIGSLAIDTCGLFARA